MKKIFLFLIFFSSVVRISAQAPQVDSLNKLLAATKEDTVKVMVLVKLSFYDQSFEHGLKTAQEGLELARKIKYEKGEADCLHQLANQYWSISNYPIALDYYLDALKIFERMNDKNSMARSYYSIGLIYKSQGDYKNAINYYRKSESMHPDDNYWLAELNGCFGDLYAVLNKQDSALMYYQRSYENYNLVKDKYQLNLTLNGLGEVQFKMGNIELALAYYREAIRNGISYNDSLGLSFTFLNIAKLYEDAEPKDSSIFYAGLSMLCAQKASVLENVIESGKLLSKLYEGKNDKEALRYLQISLAARDSLFSRDRTMQIQNLLFNETKRESEIAEIEKKDEAERKLDIEYALITLGIIIFIILFLLLSRSFITSTKLIEFLGVMALLIVFEFFNLFLDPFLERVTNHTPVLMLLGLVCVAAFLIPLHNKVEKWSTAKLVEKNKAIRLANAKKTIEQLEERIDNK
ncbi:MAG TPA: tetratricopeptide repeat protein [Ignavibacteria bacterium]